MYAAGLIAEIDVPHTIHVHSSSFPGIDQVQHDVGFVTSGCRPDIWHAFVGIVLAKVAWLVSSIPR